MLVVKDLPTVFALIGLDLVHVADPNATPYYIAIHRNTRALGAAVAG